MFLLLLPQMKKAVSHYNNKKQLLQESQQEVSELRQALELRDRQLKAESTNNQTLQLQLDQAHKKEQGLINTVASLEAQVSNCSTAVFILKNLGKV